MSDLLDVDGLGKGRLLGVVSFEVDFRGNIGNAVSSRRRVVAGERRSISTCYRRFSQLGECYLLDLLAHQLGHARVVLPLAQEQLAEEWVERLLLISILLASGGILLLECRQEPLEHEQRPLCGVRLLCRSGKDTGMLAPVRAELGETGGGKNEGRRSQ
jgi:hypothetical protein